MPTDHHATFLSYTIKLVMMCASPLMQISRGVPPPLIMILIESGDYVVVRNINIVINIVPTTKNDLWL